MPHHGESFIPESCAFPVRLECGTPAIVRPIAARDVAKLVEGLDRLSEQSRVCRFLYNKTAFSSRELHEFTHCDGMKHIALVLALLDECGREIDAVAVARSIRDTQDPRLAEVAVATVDEWQGHGIGSILIKALACCARKTGVMRWRAVCFSGHRAAHKILNRAVGTLLRAQSVGSGVEELIYEIEP